MIHLLTENLGAHAGIGKDFQQERVRDTAIHNGDAVNTASDGIQRTIDLGQHPFTDRPVGNQRLDLVFF